MTKFACFLGGLLALGIFSADLVQAAEKKVQVESPYQLKIDKSGKKIFEGTPYIERRPSWGIRLNFAATSGFETQNAQLHPVTSVPAPLESSGVPLHVNIGMSRNFKHFSIGPELGYMSSTISSRCNLDIDFKGFTFGVGAYLDGLFKTAYAVPFVSVGAVLPDITVTKTQSGTCTADGEQELDALDFALYYRAGVLIGLNWLDKGMSSQALADYGLQNTFIYIAVKQIPSTSDIDAADIGTEPFLEYGLQFEF
jgi:hypothetical protein